LEAPQSKKKKRDGILHFGYSLSNRYAALLRGALDELVEVDISPMKILPTTLSPQA
jgi:hypothetical protein